VIEERLARQGLSGPPAHSPEAVVHRLLAVQAQDPRGARLTVRSRSVGLAARDVDVALTDRRSLVVTWLNRGTLHLVTAEDYWWLHPLTTPQLAAGNRRRLSQEGVAAAQVARGVAVVIDAVRSDGPQTRAQLRRRLDTADVPTAGQALVHVLFAASNAGHVVRGPLVGKEQAFVDARDWLGDAPEPLARREGLARLARRYLAGHGPARAADLAKWAGLTLGDARAGLAGIAEELSGRLDGLVQLSAPAAAARASVTALPSPRLLGAFDPLLLGWASRAPFVGDHLGIVTTNGIFRPVALVDGRVVATWALAAGAITVRLLEAVAPPAQEVLRADAGDVCRFLGLDAPTTITIDD
jgi:Winged helix DNA-binding domain